MDRRGQIFPFFLVILTFVLCASVILIYFSGQNKVNVSLVSPRAVLEVRDGLEEFEFQEKALILESLEGVGADFVGDEFIEEFRNELLEKVGVNDEMKRYLFSNLYFNGRDISSLGGGDSSAFFKNTLYPEDLTYFDDGTLHFSRAKVSKQQELRASGGVKKIKYDFGFNFEFEKEYLISYENREFIVGEAK